MKYETQKLNRFGVNNPNYKNGLTNNAKCKLCGKRICLYTATTGEGKCLICENKSRAGKRHHWYISGNGKTPYTLEFNDKLKEKIRKRDDYTCQNCEITEEEHLKKYNRKIEVHHIDYNKQNCKENNLITLCKECNIMVNFNKKYWKNKFLKIIKFVRRLHYA